MGTTYAREINHLMKVLDAIRGDEIDMSMQQAQAFLAVIMRPGLTMQNMADMVGMSQSSCSRNVAALSKEHRLHKPGLNFVEAIQDPVEWRRKVMYLTPLGVLRARKVIEALTGEMADYDPPTAKNARKV